jgi:hypothetical protein
VDSLIISLRGGGFVTLPPPAFIAFRDANVRSRLFPQRPRPSAVRVAVMRWRSGQIKALGHFENGNPGDIFVGLIAEDLGQKNDVFKDLRRGCLLPNTRHGQLLSTRGSLFVQKTKRRSIGDPMSAFAQPKAALPSLGEMSNCHAMTILRKSLDITDIFFIDSGRAACL